MQEKFEQWLVIILIIVLGILSLLIVRPFISAIFTAMILAYIFYPVYKGVNKVIKWKGFSAAIICIFVIVLIAIPTWFLVPNIVRQAYGFYNQLQTIDVVTPLKKIIPIALPEEIQRDLIVISNQAILKATSSFTEGLSGIISNLPMTIMQLVVIFFVFFFALRDSDKLVNYLKGFSPFTEDVEKKFMERFRNVTKSVIYGMFIVGLVEGFLAGIAYHIFGAPHPLFLTALSTLFAILPFTGSGSWIIWLPTSIVMILAGNPGGTYLLVYGFLILVWIDPVIRPYIVRRGAGIPHGIALIGMLGGYLLFGIIGFIIGPLILGYLILFLEFYKERKLGAILKKK